MCQTCVATAGAILSWSATFSCGNVGITHVEATKVAGSSLSVVDAMHSWHMKIHDIQMWFSLPLKKET